MEKRFSFTIDAKIENIPVVADAIESYLTDIGTGTEVLTDIQLAVDEAVTNIIMHGYRKGPGTITLTVAAEAGTVRIEIRDRAPAFNPLNAKEPDITAGLADRVVGGMGIFLIRKVMDAVSYEYKDGENVLRMEKRITAQ